MHLVTATKARNRFGVLIELAATGPVGITRKGKVVAVLLDVSSFRDIENDLTMTEACRRLLNQDSAARNALRGYSRGEVPRSVVMDLLGLEDYGQLLDVLGRTGLPMPQCPPEQIAAMVKVMLDVFDQADEVSDQADKP